MYVLVDPSKDFSGTADSEDEETRINDSHLLVDGSQKFNATHFRPKVADDLGP